MKTEGGSLEVTFPGLSMGIFEGSLGFTVYRGTNLIRMDAVAKTEEQWIAYKYDEILIKSYAILGSGNDRTITADAEWTYPLSFVEIVWGDGQKVGRRSLSATDLPPFGRKRFSLPFDATGKVWVRFAIWDSAGNGAFVQPAWLMTH